MKKSKKNRQSGQNNQAKQQLDQHNYLNSQKNFMLQTPEGIKKVYFRKLLFKAISLGVGLGFFLISLPLSSLIIGPRVSVSLKVAALLILLSVLVSFASQKLLVLSENRIRQKDGGAG